MVKQLCESGGSVDVSGKYYPKEIKAVPSWEIALKIFIGVVINLFAFFGNLLVVAVVKKSKNISSTTRYYIMNLAVSDFLVGCGPIWLHVVNNLADSWVMGAFLCKFNTFFQIVAMYSSMFTLTVLAIDRFFAIMFPLKSLSFKRPILLIILCIWISAITMATPLLFYYKYTERQWLNHIERFCDSKWPMLYTRDGCDGGRKSKQIFWTFFCIVLNWVPMVVCVTAYTVIGVQLRFNWMQPNNGVLSAPAIYQKSKHKIVKMLFSILIVFMICSLPFQVSVFYDLYRDAAHAKLPEWYHHVYFSAILLLYSNSAINPIIYNWMNGNFRAEFKLFAAKLLRIRNPQGRLSRKRNTIFRVNTHEGIQWNGSPVKLNRFYMEKTQVSFDCRENHFLY